MPDQKVSELTLHTLPASEDLLLIVDDPNGTPASKRITLKTLFGSITSNTVINGNTTRVNGSNAQFTANLNSTGITTVNQLVIANNNLRITTAKTPASNNPVSEFGAGRQGTMFFDTNYLYVAVSNTVIKRVALSTF